MDDARGGGKRRAARIAAMAAGLLLAAASGHAGSGPAARSPEGEILVTATITNYRAGAFDACHGDCTQTFIARCVGCGLPSDTSDYVLLTYRAATHRDRLRKRDVEVVPNVKMVVQRDLSCDARACAFTGPHGCDPGPDGRLAPPPFVTVGEDPMTLPEMMEHGVFRCFVLKQEPWRRGEPRAGWGR